MTDAIDRRAFGGLALGGAALLAGCANAPDPTTGERRAMGDFQLGLNIVVDDKLKQVPPSRQAPPGALKSRMEREIQLRFGGYRGGRDYHVAVSLDGYALAPPGIPIVLTPKSILIVTANLWTKEPQEKVLGPEQLTTFEGPEGLILGSGYIKSAEEQMDTLTRNMAYRIQSWILREGGPLLGLQS